MLHADFPVSTILRELERDELPAVDNAPRGQEMPVATTFSKVSV